MNEEKRNEITYDENWQNVSYAEYPVTVKKNKDEDKMIEKKVDSPKQLLITIQLLVCIIIILVAFIIKSFGGELYKNTNEWYYSNLNSSAIFDNTNEISLEEFFQGSTEDEV